MDSLALTRELEKLWSENPLGRDHNLYRTRGMPFARDVMRVAARHFRLPVDYLIADRRSVDIVYARHVAMYMAYRMTNNSTPMIGRVFGGRDHTTVLHAVKKIERFLQEERPRTVADVEEIKRGVLAIREAAPCQTE
jgi:chromosomal replication initiation ATPase DnaA